MTVIPQLEGRHQQHLAHAQDQIRALIQALEVMAKEKGGQLTQAQIGAAGKAFLAEMASSDAFAAICRICITDAEALAVDEHRHDYFGRILVGRFDHLLGNGSPEEGALSRAVLNRFFLALHKMLGDDTLESLRAHCADIVGRLREERQQAGGAFRFEDATEAPEIRALVQSVLTNLALHFVGYEKRKEWFIRVMNQQLPPVEIEGQEQRWSFEERHFVRMISALFGDLRNDLKNPEVRRRLEGEFDPGSLSRLDDMFTALDRDAVRLEV